MSLSILSVDTERLINEVRLRPMLWDLSHDLYKNKDARIEAWREVCLALQPNFQTMDVEHQKEIEKAIQLRWRNAKDSYMKCKASLKFTPSGSKGKSKKKYVYYEYLVFLDKGCPTQTEDSLSTSSEAAVQLQEQPHFQSQEPQHRQDPEDEGTVDPAESTQNLKKTWPRKRRNCRNDVINEFDKELLKVMKTQSENMQNDDMAFFVSLLPILKKFSDQQKLVFRSAVLKTAMDVSGMSAQATQSPSQYSFHAVPSPAESTISASSGSRSHYVLSPPPPPQTATCEYTNTGNISHQSNAATTSSCNYDQVSLQDLLTFNKI